MFNHLDGVMRALARKKIQFKADLYFAVKCAQQMLSKQSSEVTRTTGLLLLSAHILDPFQRLRYFRKWEKGMDHNPDDEDLYTTQYHKVFLKYLVYEYCGKHQRLSVNKPERDAMKNHFATIFSGSGQSSFDPSDLSSDGDEYFPPKTVSGMTPGRSDRAPHLLTASRLYLNSPPQAPKNCRQFNRNCNDYHFNPIEISSTFWLPDITDWWHQQQETHSKYADLSNVARDIVSLIPHVVGVEDSFSLTRDMIGWRQSKTTHGTLREIVVGTLYSPDNNGIWAGNDPVLDTTEAEHNIQLQREAEERKLHRMAKVHDILEMWQGSQNIRATQRESRAQNTQNTAIGYILDT
jgi:hypothetical protein